MKLRIGKTGFRALIVTAFALMSGLLLMPGSTAEQQMLKMSIPLGLPADTWDYYVPRNNPMTAAKVELGRKLFFDAQLSADGKVSCASCHDQKLGFSDGKKVAEGVGGRLGARNSPGLLNVIFNPDQFWDGRAGTLEDQAIQPLVNALEMGNASHDEVVDRLKTMAGYRADFQSVFGGDVTIARVGQALASYERTLVSGDSPFDRYIIGNPGQVSEAAARGFALFRGRARCSRCHTFSAQMPFFTDFNYHNTGVVANHPNFDRLARQAFAITEKGLPEDVTKKAIDKLVQEDGGQELGRFLVSRHVLDLGSYRTPSLRNVALTAPYFHDGSARTLADVVRFYNEGGKMNLNREWDLAELMLTEGEQRDLVAFLESLTGQLPEMPPEQEVARKIER
jgi:cytochrome c peroxidase